MYKLISEGVPLPNHLVPLRTVPNFTKLQKLNLCLPIQFSMHTNSTNTLLCLEEDHSSQLSSLFTQLWF